MSEILFITNEQDVLNLADQLGDQVNVRVDIVNDFSQGLKEIFFKQPAVVFVQNEIGGITGEKVANQVRALLEGEPIRLVLLHHQTGGWEVNDVNFDGNIDLSLPYGELIGQIRQQVCDAIPGALESPVESGPAAQPELDTIELTDESLLADDDDDEFKIDSLADIFPSQFPPCPEPSLHGNGDDGPASWAQGVAGAELTGIGEEFSFDTLPESVPPIREEAVPHALTDSDVYYGPSADFVQEQPRPVHEEGQEVTRRGDGRVESLSAATGKEETAKDNAEPEPAAGPHETLPHVVVQPPSWSEQIPPAPGDGISAAIPTRIGSERQGGLRNRADMDADFYSRLDLPVKRFPASRLILGSTILILLAAATYMALDLWMPERDEMKTIVPPAPVQVSRQELPAFIPRVAPDSAYAAAHPGWERREADGLEYLIFRENGRIKALQVIAESQGVIAEPFVKKCLRETMGREDCDRWVRENRDSFLVEKGTLVNKGELAIYRKMPEGDIRGLVLSFS